MRDSGLNKLLYVLLIFTGISCPVYAEFVNNDNVHLNCNHKPEDTLFHCQLRLASPDIINHISANSGEQSLQLADKSVYPGNNSVTAILFLVDTSDPAREKVVEKNKLDIRSMLSLSRDHQQLGLARFDKGFKLLAPIGSSREKLVEEVNTLRATGKITELYRSMLSAIDLLERVKADRKAIYLLSDGLAEDKAYYHDDVVNAARRAGIVITSLGYPRSISKSVALQTMRRLSEETGGQFIEANENYQLPDQFTDNPFAGIDNGLAFTLDISSLDDVRVPEIPVTVNINATKGDYSATINLPAPFQVIKQPESTVAPVARPSRSTGEADSSQPVRIITRETTVTPFNKWFWYGVPAVLIALLVVTIGILLASTFRQKRKSTKTQTSNEFKPYAYLVLQDESKKRYSITRTTWRIGRGNDNEMVLNDNSVSRRHAEIHRDKGDLFTIYDLDSLNGIYINNNKVSKSLLHEGDIIEIGDINLRFTLLSTDFSIEESTVMQNTRTPMTH